MFTLHNHETVQFKILIMAFPFTEERISKSEKELENANDLLAAARQRGNKDTCNSINQVLTFMYCIYMYMYLSRRESKLFKILLLLST